MESPRGIRIRNKIYLAGGEHFEWPDSEAEIKGDTFACYGLKDHFGILADGTVVPCCLDSDGVINLGNILEQDIESILNSSRATNMVEGFKQGKASEDLCKRCLCTEVCIKYFHLLTWLHYGILKEEVYSVRRNPS